MLVAGSTLDGEEAMLLEMFRQVLPRYPEAVLVLAPRHPERFEVVASLLAVIRPALPAALAMERKRRRSRAGVFLLDSIGELASLYEFADLAFIGGSLVPRGGHNVLEAAQFGTPILVGPHTENFRDIVEIFRRADALARGHSAVVDRDRAATAGERRRARSARPPRFRSHALAAGRNRANRQRAAGAAAGAGRSATGRTHLGAARVNPLSALYGAAVSARNRTLRPRHADRSAACKARW